MNVPIFKQSAKHLSFILHFNTQMYNVSFRLPVIKGYTNIIHHCTKENYKLIIDKFKRKNGISVDLQFQIKTQVCNF